MKKAKNARPTPRKNKPYHHDIGVFPPSVCSSSAELVENLHTAATLEHSLLCSYLWAAYSLKSHYLEFEECGPYSAAIFEETRRWKHDLVEISREEMLHLDLVQRLLRSLNSPAYFQLNYDDSRKGFYFPDWSPQVTPGTQGTTVTLDRLSVWKMQQNIIFESATSAQETLFSPENVQNYQLALHYEDELWVAIGLYYTNLDETQKNAVTAMLMQVIEESGIQAPSERRLKPSHKEFQQFQSVADFYNEFILAKFQELTNIPVDNTDLNEEQKGQVRNNVPVGPVYRNPEVTDRYRDNMLLPVVQFSDVQRMVNEIIGEGEGYDAFDANFEKYLAYMADPKIRADLAEFLSTMDLCIYIADQPVPVKPPNPPSEEVQFLQYFRSSHEFRYIMMFSQATRGNVCYPDRYRTPIDLPAQLIEMRDTMPMWFNVIYSIMLLWLARNYDLPAQWDSDAVRRQASNFCTWPLMSIGIRPFLEMASLFVTDDMQHLLFRIDGADGTLPETAASDLLFWLYSPPTNEQQQNAMDDACLKWVDNLVQWASSWLPLVQEFLPPYENINPTPRDKDHLYKLMIITKLRSIISLKELSPQVAFRQAGGYSSCTQENMGSPPNQEYINAHKDEQYRCEEDPAQMVQGFLSPGSQIMKFDFSGWAQFQIANDYDPTAEESGSSGHTFVHNTDEDGYLQPFLSFDLQDGVGQLRRGPLWENADSPPGALPPLGVSVKKVSLFRATDYTAVAMPPAPSSTAPPQYDVSFKPPLQWLQDVPITSPLTLHLDPKDVPNDNLYQRPSYIGLNHLIWQDGEPVDSFVLRVQSDDGSSITRSVYGDTTFQDMTPMERGYSQRGPNWVTFVGSLPDWVYNIPQGQVAQQTTYALNHTTLNPNYLIIDDTIAGMRIQYLGSLLYELSQNWSLQDIPTIMAYFTRNYYVTIQIGLFTFSRFALCNFGHTISGQQSVSGGFDGFVSKDAGDSRCAPNSRWLITYNHTLFDFDSSRGLFFGSLYVPLGYEKSAPEILKQFFAGQK